MTNPSEARFSPLARIGIGAALVGGAALLFSIRGCGEGERPTIGQQAPAVSTTTTHPENKEAERPWYEKFGWDNDYTNDVAAELVNDLTGPSPESRKVAAGRCIVTLYDGGKSNYYSVMKNPIVIESEYKGVKFTTFVGLIPHEATPENSGGKRLAYEKVSVVGGEVFWGDFGIIPDQTDVVDDQGIPQIRGGDPVVHKPGYYDDSDGNVTYYQLPIGPNGYRVGEVVRIEESRLDLVAKHCLSPASKQAMPPESVR